MTTIHNCNKCVHKKVCSEKSMFSEYTSLIRKVTVTSKFVNMELTCTHFKGEAKKRKSKKEVTDVGKKLV